MDFRIADAFTDALARLPAAEQKAVMTSAFDLRLDLRCKHRCEGHRPFSVRK